MAVRGGCWDSELIFPRVCVRVRLCASRFRRLRVCLSLNVCSPPLTALMFWGSLFTTSHHGESRSRKPQQKQTSERRHLYWSEKKKKSCFQENKRSGRGLVLIGSGVWGKWGEKRIISSWEMVKFYREFLGEVPTIRDAENPVPVIESSSTEMRCLSSLTESRYGTDTTGIWTLHLKWFYLLTLRDSLYKVHTKPSWTILHFSGDFRHSKPLMLFEPLYCSFSFFFFFGVKSVDNKKSLRLQCSSSKCLYMGWYRLFVGPTLSVQA